MATLIQEADIASGSPRRTNKGTFHIVTLGCSKNTVDSEAMEQLLLAAGHRRAETTDAADLVIVNTCGFI
jgi:ribosomal protein S12 methylthiotransferase